MSNWLTFFSFFFSKTCSPGTIWSMSRLIDVHQYRLLDISMLKTDLKYVYTTLLDHLISQAQCLSFIYPNYSLWGRFYHMLLSAYWSNNYMSRKMSRFQENQLNAFWCIFLVWFMISGLTVLDTFSDLL